MTIPDEIVWIPDQWGAKAFGPGWYIEIDRAISISQDTAKRYCKWTVMVGDFQIDPQGEFVDGKQHVAAWDNALCKNRSDNEAEARKAAEEFLRDYACLR